MCTIMLYTAPFCGTASTYRTTKTQWRNTIDVQWILTVSTLIFLLLFISECGAIILRHNRIIIYVSAHFTFGKNACSAFEFTWMFERLCRSNRSYVFFGAQLRLRTFFMYLLRELVGQSNDPVIKIKTKDV